MNDKMFFSRKNLRAREAREWAQPEADVQSAKRHCQCDSLEESRIVLVAPCERQACVKSESQKKRRKTAATRCKKGELNHITGRAQHRRTIANQTVGHNNPQQEQQAVQTISSAMLRSVSITVPSLWSLMTGLRANSPYSRLSEVRYAARAALAHFRLARLNFSTGWLLENRLNKPFIETKLQRIKIVVERPFFCFFVFFSLVVPTKSVFVLLLLSYYFSTIFNWRWISPLTFAFSFSFMRSSGFNGYQRSMPPSSLQMSATVTSTMPIKSSFDNLSQSNTSNLMLCLCAGPGGGISSVQYATVSGKPENERAKQRQ